MGLLIYKYEPFWQEVSVKSLILRWPLRPVGLLLEFVDRKDFRFWVKSFLWVLIHSFITCLYVLLSNVRLALCLKQGLLLCNIFPKRNSFLALLHSLLDHALLHLFLCLLFFLIRLNVVSAELKNILQTLFKKPLTVSLRMCSVSTLPFKISNSFLWPWP